MILESFLVFLFSSLTATVMGALLVRWAKNVLFAGRSSLQMMKISIQLVDLGFLAVAGSGLLLFAVTISLLPVLRTNPKDTLAAMDE